MRPLQRRLPWQAARDGAADNEAGAVLILALVFLVAVSLIVLGILSWLGTSLSATTTFRSERSLEGAATNGVNLAIQYTRTNFVSQSVNVSPPVACMWTGTNGTGSALQPQPDPNSGISIDVWCSMAWASSSTSTRVVTYSACLSSVSAAACANAPLLQAVATFDDYAVGIVVPAPTPVPCSDTGLCGQTMTQNSWQWRPVVPAVSSISPTTSTISGGITLTITGTGFVAGSSVNFVEESNDTPTSANLVLTIPAAQVQVSGCTGPNGTCTTATVSTPPVTSGTQYFVTVTTPGGTSAYVPTGGGPDLDVVQYSVVAPTLSCLTGPGGASPVGSASCPGSSTAPGGTITGGNAITITGTGFYNASNFAAQVWFCLSSCSSTKVQAPASSVQVVSNTEITAVTPAVGSASNNWFVEVVTTGGTTTNTNDYFEYSRAAAADRQHEPDERRTFEQPCGEPDHHHWQELPDRLRQHDSLVLPGRRLERGNEHDVRLWPVGIGIGDESDGLDRHPPERDDQEHRLLPVHLAPGLQPDLPAIQ